MRSLRLTLLCSLFPLLAGCSTVGLISAAAQWLPEAFNLASISSHEESLRQDNAMAKLPLEIARTAHKDFSSLASACLSGKERYLSAKAEDLVSCSSRAVAKDGKRQCFIHYLSGIPESDKALKREEANCAGASPERRAIVFDEAKALSGQNVIPAFAPSPGAPALIPR